MEEDRMADTPDPHVGTYVLRLHLGRGEALIGSITPVGAIRGIEFHGWIDFMSAVNLLRAEPRGTRPDGAE
jgi:hypothetical protein